MTQGKVLFKDAIINGYLSGEKCVFRLAKKVGCSYKYAVQVISGVRSAPGVSGRLPSFNWSSVKDWSKPDTYIARELGCHPSTVFYHRKKYITPAPNQAASQGETK